MHEKEALVGDYCNKPNGKNHACFLRGTARPTIPAYCVCPLATVANSKHNGNLERVLVMFCRRPLKIDRMCDELLLIECHRTYSLVVTTIIRLCTR